MPNIHIQQAHALGLAKARKIAWAWAEEVEAKYQMECTVQEGSTEDTVHFTRPGVQGTLDVTATGFELKAKLGLLLGAFSKTIETQIHQELQAQLKKAGPTSKTR